MSGKKGSKGGRKKLPPEELQRRKEAAKQKRIEKKFRDDVKSIFALSGFKAIKTEGKEFQFKGRTGELDNIFVYENIIVVCEDTYSKDVGKHLLAKKVLFDLINDNSGEFIDFLIETFDDFKTHHSGVGPYHSHHYEVKIVYVSRHPISDEHIQQCGGVYFFDYPRLRYFSSLVKIIGKSAKYELFKFFQLNFQQIGEIRIKGGVGYTKKGYEGFLLPEPNSNFPKGYKVLSFYVDPEMLLQKSYVLRKDSWADPDSSYQRMLEPKKIKSMRRYLNNTKRVYVNNLITTLPSNAKISQPKTSEYLGGNALLDVKHVEIQLPDEFNSIGIIDGQHRIFSYHEGNDVYEENISKLRKCQNLLVTAIMYPKGISELERTQFEATLFLEINDEQTKARGDLKQAIELIVRPFSTTAIAKAVISRLAKRGPLAGMLEEHYFDDENKIKTSSIVSYGLRPLVKLEGNDSIMKIWDHPDKDSIKQEDNKPLLDAYIDFCATKINDLLIAAKLNIGSDAWSNVDRKSRIVTPTLINGFIVCLRELIKAEYIGSKDSYQTKLVGIESFDFSKYKSSHWKQLGVAIFDNFFAISES